MNYQLTVWIIILFWNQSVCAIGHRVKANSGWIEGIYNNASNHGDTVDFLGIPYAKPPVGNLRFKPPLPHDGWNGTFEAKKYGHACYQNEAFLKFFWVLPDRLDEDCLTLNIHVPGTMVDAEREEKLAVMVFIHGGGFTLGSSISYIGNDMAAKENIIIVTLNYRLDIFGFLTIGDERIPGNMGLLDQVLALEWVQNNIGQFGGDKGSVTIFGQGSGSRAVSLHIVSPRSKGLFRRAISQSGNDCTILKKYEVREKIKDQNETKSLLEALGCHWNGTDDAVKCLQSVDASVIYKMKPKSQYHPVVDGENGFMPEQPYELWNNHRFEPKDYLAGILRDDGEIILRFFLAGGYKLLQTGVSLEQVSDITRWFLSAAMKTDRINFLSLVRDQYFTSGDKYDNVRGLLDAYRDFTYFSPTVKALNIMNSFRISRTNTYLYYIARKSSTSHYGYPVDLGPIHHDDMMYFFGHFAEASLNISDIEQMKDVFISHSLIHAWTTFAKEGKPKYLDSNGTEYEWLAYDQTNEYYLDIESDIGPGSMKKRLLPRANSFWNKIIPAILADKECADQDDNPSLISRETAETALFLLCAVVLCLLLALLIICANSAASKPKSGKT